MKLFLARNFQPKLPTVLCSGLYLNSERSLTLFPPLAPIPIPSDFYSSNHSCPSPGIVAQFRDLSDYIPFLYINSFAPVRYLATTTHLTYQVLLPGLTPQSRELNNIIPPLALAPILANTTYLTTTALPPCLVTRFRELNNIIPYL